MAKLVFGMNQSLDGYVDHMAFAPSPTLFRHFIEEAQWLADSPTADTDAVRLLGGEGERKLRRPFEDCFRSNRRSTSIG